MIGEPASLTPAIEIGGPNGFVSPYAELSLGWGATGCVIGQNVIPAGINVAVRGKIAGTAMYAQIGVGIVNRKISTLHGAAMVAAFQAGPIGVAETVISSTTPNIACIASRTPGNGPAPWTMSAIIALTPLPQRIIRSAVSDGFSAAHAATPLSDNGNLESMKSVSSG